MAAFNGAAPLFGRLLRDLTSEHGEFYGVLSIKNGDLMGLNMGFKGFPKSWVKKYEGLKRIHR